MLLLTNARILTLDEKNSITDSILIDGDQIVGVGSHDDFSGLPLSTTQINLGGATVTPGFTDSHLHLLHYAKSLSIVDCDTSTRKECLTKVELAIQQTKIGEWVRGHGWNSNHWRENEINRYILDSISPNNPVYLSNKSLHGAWVNSLALSECGINENTPNPEGGKIGRDEKGLPNGVLYESAVSLVTDLFPELTDSQAVEMMNTAQNELFQYGITTVHDFDRIPSFKALQQLEVEKRLQLRVLKSLPVEVMDEVITVGLRSGMGSSHLTHRGIKLFADGALGTKTAAMLSPYENSTESGMLLLEEDELIEFAQKASQNHLQLAIHAIGDMANRMVIETFTKLRHWETDNNIIGLPHRIEHLQTCQLEDIQKLKGLNVIASVQPIHLASDIPAAEKYLGKRCKGTYAFNSFHQAGIPMVFGSDAPVEVPDCLLGIHTAIRRTQRDDTPGKGWQSQEKIQPLEALKGFTRYPHQYLPLNDTLLGQLKPGFKADLVVLNDFPLFAEDNLYKDLQIQKTMIDGKWVWENE